MGRWSNAKIQSAIAAERLLRARARASLLDFVRYCWWNPLPLKVGRHTRAIAERLTRAVYDFEDGRSTYLIVTVPFRHGKSDLVSKALPAWFMCRDRALDPSVILSGYGASLVESFSRASMRIIAGEKCQRVFPGISLGKRTAKSWSLSGGTGEVTAVGLGGAVTGKGGNLIIVDDYCKNRAEAASKTFRERTWNAFRSDIFTRQNAPAAIVVIVATPWHVDDLIGRIEAEQGKDGFPKFEHLSFPASRDGDYDYLFPELYPPEWYEAQRAMLGRTQSAALLDCSPVVEGGNRFDPESGVNIHETLDGWPAGKREFRCWDLASSAKERSSDDPDWTWGVRGCVTFSPGQDGVRVPHLWIRSMVAVRAEAPQRDRVIRETAKADGLGVAQVVERFGAYKDAYVTLRDALRGIATVRGSMLPGDKTAKAAPLEPVFEASNVHVFLPGCKAHLDRWRDDFRAFPDGAHDDAVDATAILFHEAAGLGTGSRIIF